MPAGSPFELLRNPGNCFSAPRRQVELGKNVFGKIFMDVIDDSSSARPEKESHRYQFGVMKMVDIGMLPPRFPVDPPNGTRHPRKPRLFPLDGFDIDVIGDSIHWMRANDRHLETYPRERPAFPVENAGVESGVNRRQVNGNGSLHGLAVWPGQRLELGNFRRTRIRNHSSLRSSPFSAQQNTVTRLQFSLPPCHHRTARPWATRRCDLTAPLREWSRDRFLRCDWRQARPSPATLSDRAG